MIKPTMHPITTNKQRFYEDITTDTAAIDYPYDQTWPAADIDGRAHVTCRIPGDTEPQAALTSQGFNPTEGT